MEVLMMTKELENLCNELVSGFGSISNERKELLAKISGYIAEKLKKNETVYLVYICTHNSRRSHFGQIAAALAAEYYQLLNVKTYSGGTEATTFHPNAIEALDGLGFRIIKQSEEANPLYHVYFGEEEFTTCFSKVYNHSANPTNNFAAIMTCSDAEENCPFIPGVELRIGTTYEDPKVSDNTPQQKLTYTERFKQIATETLYAFSLVEK